MKWSLNCLPHLHGMRHRKKHEYKSEVLPPSQHGLSSPGSFSAASKPPSASAAPQRMPASKQGDASPGDSVSRQGDAAVLPEQGWNGKDVDTTYKGARICTLPEDNIQPTVSYQDQKVEGEPGTREWRQSLHPRLVSPDLPHIGLTQIAKAALLCWALGSCILLVKMMHRFSLEGIFWSFLAGIGLGLCFYMLMLRNRRRKREMDHWFNDIMENKDVMRMLGGKPSWMSYKRDEQVQCLNRMMVLLWPSLDKAVGESIRQSVEPLMHQYKPFIIKGLNFKQLTFGDSPIRFEDAIIDDEVKDRVAISAPFRLTGNSNIGISIEVVAMSMLGGATKMVSKITDLHIRGTLRLELANLTSELPGFGAIVCSLEYPPMVHFQVDMGSAMGGHMSGKLVAAWLDEFLRETLATQFVWPYRYVYPMLPESPQNNLKELQLRHKGVLHVRVVEAKGLKDQDMMGKGDPLVRCWVQPHVVESTKHKRSTTKPHWDQTLYLLAQEPHSQFMRLEVYDWDGINLKMMLSSPNLVTDLKESLGARVFMARTAVQLGPAADEPGREHDDWYELGRNGWSDSDGTGDGHGKIHLQLRYFPFDMLYSKPRQATHGAVLVRLLEAHDMAAADEDGLCDPYFKFRMAHIHHKSSIKEDSRDATWDEEFEFPNVSINQLLTVEAFDNDSLARDDKLGMVEINIQDEIAAAEGCTLERVWYLAEVPKDEKSGNQSQSTVSLRVQWVPFDFDPDV